MIKAATIRVQVEPDLKKEVEKIFENLGLTAAEAITLFLDTVRTKKEIIELSFEGK
ncbi:MAG: type II toxin-antitoxin system RelB/DinJ family antitoxin [Candidatus Omnitrophota bacterium]